MPHQLWLLILNSFVSNLKMIILPIQNFRKLAIYSLLFGAFIVFLVCDLKPFPIYWSCEGVAVQKILSPSGMLKEQYIDDRPIVLDVWGDSIYQFYQPTLSSYYAVCNADEKNMHFEFPNCNVEISNGLMAKGVLQVTSGLMTINETRMIGNKVITNEGHYQCQNLGRHFSFATFNYAKP